MATRSTRSINSIRTAPNAAPGKRTFPGASLSKPTQPWVPNSVVIHPVGTAKTTRRGNRMVKCWDVRGTIDGWPYFKRFTQPDGTAEQARAWARTLARDYHRGWAYDPTARRFVDPRATVVIERPEDGEPTVLDCALDFLDRKWELAWEPKSRQAAVRALKRACVHLVSPAVPDPAPSTGDVDTYLDAVLRPSKDRGEALDEGPAAAGHWLRAWSKPIAEVTWQELEALVAHYRQNQRNPAKAVSLATERRFVADLKNMWADAAARHGFPDPWPAVHRADRHGRRRRNQRLQPVDKDVVLSPHQVAALAQACADRGSWGEVVVCFVLVMGLCGLRPSEALGLSRGDLELPGYGGGWITVRQSHRRVADRWLEPDEDPEWGPLKDRLTGEQRRVPVPSWLVPKLREHVRSFCDSSQSDPLLFTRFGRPFELSTFDRDVWQPARSALFPADRRWPADDPRQARLSRLRRHDLRHAACSLWLNAGVDAKVCQAWSGHKTLSVFLDVYQGIMPGREDEGVQAVDLALQGFQLMPNASTGRVARARRRTNRTAPGPVAQQAGSTSGTKALLGQTSDRRSKAKPEGRRRSATG